MESKERQLNTSSANPGGLSRILIVDDDRELCALLKDYLQPLGYDISIANQGFEGLELALTGKFHAILLDVMLPGMNGFDVLKKIRQQSDVPVLMLTARGEEVDRIAGLEVGADDYLPKTFSTRELLARLRAVMRRAEVRIEPPKDGAEREIVVGHLRIHPGMRRAVLGDQPLDLTTIEFDLLACLARSRGRVKSREELVEAIADRNYDVFDRSIDVHIWALRKKLGDDPKNPRFIKTIRATGYMLIHEA